MKTHNELLNRLQRVERAATERSVSDKQWQATVTATQAEHGKQINWLEWKFGETENLLAVKINLLKEITTAQGVEIELLKKQNAELVEKYNQAIDVINDLSKRLAELEKNYDPTVIG